MADAYATVRFTAADAADAERIVSGWALPGASAVEVAVITEQTQTINVAEQTEASPISVGESGELLLGEVRPA